MHFPAANIALDCRRSKSVVSSRSTEGPRTKYILLLSSKHVTFMVKYEWSRMGNSELLGDTKK